jgi:hydrogenase maturation protein HypF
MHSGSPLCIDAAEALDRLAGIADAFLVHDRAIARPLDDSLLQLIDGRPALLRRARGYAPHALALHTPQPGVSLSWKAPDAPGAERNGNPERPPPQATRATRVAMEGATAERPAALLALGSDLKSAPALAIDDRLWLAPHLGDLADGLCLERWRIGLSELLERQRGSLAGVAIDAHPQYLSVQLAEPLLARPGPQPLAVAHHRAHGLAVAAEHGLPLPLPALVLDGLGYGGGTVPLWGCELLWLEADGARRLASLRPFPLPGGERAAREPRRSALGLLWAADLLEHPGAAALRAAFAGAERELLLQALATGCNSPWCSSAGRLFDAIASLLNLVQRASHEGHAALLVQTAASRATDHGDAYPLPLRQARTTAEPDQPGMPQLDWLPMLKDLLDDVASFRSQEHCAARFQAGLVRGLAAAIVQLCPSAEPNRGLATDAPWRLSRIRRDGSGGAAVILAGGCFQNRALLEGLIAELRRRNLRPYWAERLPGNDGGLAVGQLLALQAQLARRAGRT